MAGAWLMFLHDCEVCGATEERIFTDSFSGKEFCIECLSKVLTKLTNSPGSEGDNLDAELKAADLVSDES